MAAPPPPFEEIVDAFDARQRAIRYKVADLRQTIESEQTLGSTYQRMNLDTTLYDPSGAHIRLSVWEDGSVWVTVEPGSKGKGWKLRHKVESTVEGLSAQEVIRRFEKTVQLCARPGGGRDAGELEALEQLWSAS